MYRKKYNKACFENVTEVEIERTFSRLKAGKNISTIMPILKGRKLKCLPLLDN